MKHKKKVFHFRLDPTKSIEFHKIPFQRWVLKIQKRGWKLIEIKIESDNKDKEIYKAASVTFERSSKVVYLGNHPIVLSKGGEG